MRNAGKSDFPFFTILLVIIAILFYRRHYKKAKAVVALKVKKEKEEAELPSMTGDHDENLISIEPED
jgi:hypothetical protein